MIPKFPEFKKLELSDQKEIEVITSKYPPYSDFDFATMWSWDVRDKLEISLLLGNIILIYEDPFDGQLKITYLGNDKIKEVLQNLFELLENTHVYKPQISNVPEVSLKGIDFTKYFIEIDLRSCDYVYNLIELSNYPGKRFIKKRGKSNSFAKNNPDVTTVVLDINNSVDRSQILQLNDLWLANKSKYNVHTDIAQEKIAFDRFLQAEFENTFCIGLYREKLIGYSIYTFSSQDYVISHFTKADVFYKGIYEYLMKESAVKLLNLGYRYMNYQEDMGIPNLRDTKISFNPVQMLRKYIIKEL